MPDAAVKPVQNPLTCIMPIKSPESYQALVTLLRQAKPMIDQALDWVRTVHFARFLFLENNTKLAIITTYDGRFEDYISDFAHYIGPIFDELFQHISDPPTAPVRQNADEFIQWVFARDVKDSGFYSAYPSRTVNDIKALDGVTPTPAPVAAQ